MHDICHTDTSTIKNLSQCESSEEKSLITQVVKEWPFIRLVRKFKSIEILYWLKNRTVCKFIDYIGALLPSNGAIIRVLATSLMQNAHKLSTYIFGM